MKKILKISMLIIPLTLIGMGFYIKSAEIGESYVLRSILNSLKQYHFQPKEINDNLSRNAFDHYLDFIDRNKRFLTKKDIKKLSVYKNELDNQALEGTYAFFDLSVKLINTQIDDCQEIYQDILSKPFDFTKKETVSFADDIDFAANKKDLTERWRTYLKYSVMTRLATAISVQDKRIEEESEDETDFKPKSMKEMEIDARKGILKNHNDWFKRLQDLERKDRLSSYINSITTLFDPHTTYFPPADKDNFDIRMSGQLEGIGAQLQEKDGYIKVMKIIPGSPSAMQGDLKANDLILKVAQGDGEAVEIVNSKINDAVKLIRGKKGTEVRLTVQKPDGSVVIIPIVRDVVVLEETYAKSVIIKDADSLAIGYTYLPSFYADFKSNKGRSCSKDIKKELQKLNNNGAQVLILDLRSNGGGSLMDVVKMAGYFIDEGPITQVKSRGKEPQILKDTKKGKEWDKPVIVMVNEFSASASEILAAALQDYKRALIVGSHTTHGKGTVQRFIDLNRTIRNVEGLPKLGSLKFTMQKFYRIDGGTTQLQGVTPDIIWPDNYTYIETGEKEQENALLVDRIKPANYTIDSNYLKAIDYAIEKSVNRTKDNAIYKAIDANAIRWKKVSDTDVFSLNLKEYQVTTKTKSTYTKDYKKLFTAYDDLSFYTMPEDKITWVADSTKQKLATKWHTRLKKDVYLYEAIQIAEDLLSQN